MNKEIIFEDNKVRSIWDEDKQKYWISVYDVISILIDSTTYEKNKKLLEMVKIKAYS